MIVEEQVTIRAARDAVWAAVADIENAAAFVRGIEKIEIVHRPADGLVGLRWRETRLLSGKPETVEKWVTEATVNEVLITRAEAQGFVFVTTHRLSDADGGTVLAGVHESRPQGLVARLMLIPMALFFKGMLRKAILQDLADIQSAVEKMK